MKFPKDFPLDSSYLLLAAVLGGVQWPSPPHNGAIYFMMSHNDFQQNFDEKRKFVILTDIFCLLHQAKLSEYYHLSLNLLVTQTSELFVTSKKFPEWLAVVISSKSTQGDTIWLLRSLSNGAYPLSYTPSLDYLEF